MRNNIYYIVIFTLFMLGVFVFYPIGAIVAWRVNPGDWNEYWRGFITILWMICSLNISDTIHEKRNKKK